MRRLQALASRSLFRLLAHYRKRTAVLTTDAYAYLNIDHPLCAWATYRGALVTPPAQPGFLSVWTAGLLGNGDPVRLRRELALEAVRAAHFPDRVSRLRGMFCFLDRASAEGASVWGGHFTPDYLAELSLSEASPVRGRQDANWITYGSPDLKWAADYWRGIPYPGAEPIWEVILEGRFWVLGTELRSRAYDRVRDEFPGSLMILEIARVAAWAGSDFGNIAGFMLAKDGRLDIVYIQDWREADDPAFHKKIQELIESGHAINRADMAPHISADSFGNLPDLRPYQHNVAAAGIGPSA